MNTHTYFATLKVTDCCVCGTPIGIISHLYDKLLENHKSFYCPNGHSQHFTGKTEAQRLREQLESKERELRAQKCETMAAQIALESEKKASLKMSMKLHRVQRGVCPCCKRSFINLKRHMETKHPEKK